MEMRTTVEQAMVKAVLELSDLELMVRADRLVKHPELSAELVSRDAWTTTTSLEAFLAHALETVG